MRATLFKLKVWADEYALMTIVVIASILTVWAARTDQPIAVGLFATIMTVSLLLQWVFSYAKGSRLPPEDPYERQVAIQSNRRSFKMVQGGRDG